MIQLGVAMTPKRNRSMVAAAVTATLCAVLLVGATMAGQGVAVLGMAWTPKPTPALVISASGPIEFTQSRPNAGLVVLDLRDVTLPERVAPVAEAAAGLRRAALTPTTGERAGARLALEVDEDVQVTAVSLPAGIELRFAKASARGSATQVSELRGVEPVAEGGGVTIRLTGHGRLTGKAFTLDNPPRVVVDFAGTVNHVSKRVHEVGAGGVQRVRVAQFASAPTPIVRVVADLERALPYSLESGGESAVLRIGAAAPVAAAVVGGTAKPVPAPAPVAVAATSPAQVKTTNATAAAAPAAAKQAPAATVPAAPAAAGPAATPVAASKAPVPKAEQAAVPAKKPDVPAVQAAAPAPIAPAPVAPAPIAPATAAASSPPAASVPTPAVTIKDDPLASAAKPMLAPPVPAAKTAARQAAESAAATSEAAMAEQAAPPVVARGTREVESQERRFTGEPISLDLKDADVRDVLKTFAKITGLNVVIDPDVSGSVTVSLDNVPWDQCLDIVLRINRLDYAVENNVLRVARIERLTQEKAQVAAFRAEEEKAKPMRTVTKSLSYAKASDVASLLTSKEFILSPRGSVVVDQRTNQLIIRDSAERLEGILNLIDGLDQPNPQVIIEARIVESTRTFSQAIGVRWGFTGNADAAHGTTTGWKFPNSITANGEVTLDKPGNGIISMTFADVLDSFNLNFALQAAEANGLVKIVSSPKVTAQNNEKAHIQSGILLPIQTVANNTVTVQYVDATLSLDVTPQITAEGTVLLDVDLKKREPLSGINLQGGQNAPISTRDAKTRLLVRDGGTTVIGGIYKFTDQDQRSGVPGLSKIPIIGALFRNTDVSIEHDELLIFITPRIIKY
jgi:type IV pilus secretin PilQ/predicted competence protein